MGIPDTCREHRCLTACQKQHRQNETAGQVDVPTRVEVPVMGDPGHVGTTDVSGYALESPVPPADLIALSPGYRVP